MRKFAQLPYWKYDDGTICDHSRELNRGGKRWQVSYIKAKIGEPYWAYEDGTLARNPRHALAAKSFVGLLKEIDRILLLEKKYGSYMAGKVCCDKAEILPCVCAFAFACPKHGERHVGTHD